MPFEVYTGMPGAGKTSLLVERLLQAHDLNLKHRKSGKPQLTINGVEYLERPIYAAGIDGLQEGLAEPLEDPSKWADLPDGALIFIDEMWKWFGHLEDASRKPPPPHVQGIAEHRHKGMDFIATTQGANQIYPFMRSLMGPHHHVVRRFGSTFIDVYTWGELVQDPSSQGMRERGQKATRTIPTKGHGVYKSASTHTIKAKIPLKMWLTAAACLLALPVLWLGIQMMRPDAIAAIGKTPAEKGQLAGPSAASKDGPAAEPDVEGKALLTPEAWAALFVPRVNGMHGSQPIFGERQAKAEPRTFCMIAGADLESRCSCWTEQGTRIKDVLRAVCYDWARNGRYDPFLEPLPDKLSANRPGGVVAPVEDGPRFAGVASGSPLDVGSPGMGLVQGK